jgi:hypothetical protein
VLVTLTTEYVRNGKPGENRGRKAMGLQPQGQDRQAAEARNEDDFSRGPGFTRPVSFAANCSDKGKPGESRGRKAMGLQPQGQDCQVAEDSA